MNKNIGILINENQLNEISDLGQGYNRYCKIARVTPIPKSSDKTLPSNYRPVSLLSILSKLLEKHLQQYLLNYLEA